MAAAAQGSLNSLPEELILQIFLRLPRKSLVRCRCVSKELRNLIDCPISKKRYEIFHNSVSDFSVMFSEGGRLFSMDFHLPDLPNSSWEKEVSIPDLKEPTFIGCCKGIVCFMVKPLFENYILLNPFNGTFQNLKCPHLYPLSSKFSIGFGYDIAADDYKIVRLEPGEHGNIQYLDVYSMRNDSSGQLVRVFNPGCSGHVIGIYVEGAIHWLWLTMNVYTCIVAFDLETDSLRSVPLPPLEVVETVQLKLHELGGRLCVFVESSNSSTIVWVMMEYGVASSWTPLFSIANEIKFVIGHFPLWDNARLLCSASDSRSWMWLNTQDGSTEDIQIHKVSRQQVYNAPGYGTQSWTCVRSQRRL